MLASTVASCGRTPREPCAQLHSEYSEPGIVLATGRLECSRLLAFLQSDKFSRGNLPAREWLSKVAGQKMSILSGLQDALTGAAGPMRDVPDWAPMPFDITPSSLPCGGLELNADHRWELEEYGLVAPGILFFQTDLQFLGFDTEVSGQQVVVRVHQDHNCDGVVGVNTMTGTFIRGLHPADGGWVPDGYRLRTPLRIGVTAGPRIRPN